MCLLEKLHYYGVICPELKWIEGFLSNRVQQVMVSDQSFQTSPVTSGVPQGTVLGPLLFLVYINDLPECVRSTACLFADDCLLYQIISTTTDAMALQQDLNNLLQWEDDWLMAFNPDKCEVLCVTNKRKITPATYNIRGHQLKQVESARYLGVDIDSRLTFNRHIDRITKQANGIKVFLQRNNNSFPCKIKASCYTTFVRPLLEYASTVWSPHTQRNMNKVEAVQRRSARYVMKDYSRYSSVTSMLQQPRTEAIPSQTHYVL